jgi:hypothetical protein
MKKPEAFGPLLAQNEGSVFSGTGTPPAKVNLKVPSRSIGPAAGMQKAIDQLKSNQDLLESAVQKFKNAPQELEKALVQPEEKKYYLAPEEAQKRDMANDAARARALEIMKEYEGRYKQSDDDDTAGGLLPSKKGKLFQD